MTDQPKQPPTTHASPLDAAKAIVDTLQGMDRDKQMLAIRFASETLGISAIGPEHQSAVVTPPPPHHAPGERPTERAHHLMDIKRFTEDKAPKSDQQFTAVVAYYYQFEAPPAQRRDSIDAAIMKEAARQAGRPQVAQWYFTLNNAKTAGYLDAVGKGAFKLNAVGENLVAITLPGNGTQSAPKTKRAAPNGKKPAKQRR